MSHTGTFLIFSADLPSGKVKRKENIDLINRKISESGLSPDISPEELYLIIDESVTNAMEHGNRWSSKKKICVDITADANTLFLKIKDQGMGFDHDCLVARLRERNLMSSRGRGIFIISNMGGISWNSKGNEVEIKIQLCDE